VSLISESHMTSGGQPFTLAFCHPTTSPCLEALNVLAGGDKDIAEGLAVWLASRDPAALAEEAKGVVQVKLNGKEDGWLDVPCALNVP
jgi:hypothetical protein